MIFGTAGEGGGDLVQGNQIGTDAAGTAPVANGGNGVFVYGTSDNVINANTLSGNAQAGVSIFSPASSAPAELNVVSGNLIGGPGGIGNLSDGVDIYSGVDNIIGQLDSWNTISGNAGNGVLLANISGQSPEGNLIAGNDIGIDPAAPNASSTQQNGVLVEGGSGNQVGVAMGSNLSDTNVPSSPSNVISGNRAAGVQFAGTASNNFVRGNYIGVNGSGVYTDPRPRPATASRACSSTTWGRAPATRPSAARRPAPAISSRAARADTALTSSDRLGTRPRPPTPSRAT